MQKGYQKSPKRIKMDEKAAALSTFYYLNRCIVKNYYYICPIQMQKNTTMKKLILPLLAATACGTLSSAPRTLGEAQDVAMQFLSQQTGKAVQLSSLSRRAMAPGANADAASQPFYAFNDTDNNAFVIVSGSDKMRPVIGYSTTGTLPENTDALPDNLRSWFQWLNEAAEYLELHPEAALTEEQRSQSIAAISPLMGSKWGQDDPYDDLCPSGCPVGCVATATAQVFRYHFAQKGEVIQGIGSHSYSWKNKTYSVNYANNTYDYSKMPLTYRNLTTAQRNEVSKISYHVAVGMDMQFDRNGSGTLTCLVPRVAKDHFGFNSLTSYVARKLFSYDEWVSMLNNELENGRPVIFGGQSSEGGHAFVLEGIDNNGLYYVNWGWYGSYDGYFDVTVLNSEGAGTGATVSEDGFCMDQDAIVNLCLDEGTGRYYTPMQIGGSNITCSKSTVTKGSSVNVTAQSIWNYSGKTQKGYVGLVLMQGDTEIHREESTTTVSAQGTNGLSIYATGQVQRKITFPSDLADGTYQLWMYFQPQGEEYYDFLRTTHTRQSYYTVVVSGNDVKLSRPTIGIPVEASNWTWETGQIETRPTTISCQLTNPSDETFVAQYFLTLIDPDGKKQEPLSSGEVVKVAPGETKTLSFDYHFTKAGHWKSQMDILRQNINEGKEPFDEADSEFDVVLNETMGASFQMTKGIEQVSDTVFLNKEATFRIQIKNTGAPYNGQMGIRFYQKTSSTTPLSEFFCDASFDQDTEDAIELTGMISGLKEKTVYYARAAYLFGDEYTTFTTKSGVSNSLSVRIYPEPVGIKDIVVDNANDLSTATIYNVLGKQISLPANGQLPRGIYIINGKKTIIK